MNVQPICIEMSCAPHLSVTSGNLYTYLTEDETRQITSLLGLGQAQLKLELELSFTWIKIFCIKLIDKDTATSK